VPALLTPARDLVDDELVSEFAARRLAEAETRLGWGASPHRRTLKASSGGIAGVAGPGQSTGDRRSDFL
jgi:hypothetical protein